MCEMWELVNDLVTFSHFLRIWTGHNKFHKITCKAIKSKRRPSIRTLRMCAGQIIANSLRLSFEKNRS